MKMRPPVIAFLTDFGDEDWFVASLKAVILSLNPRATVVDISHRIPSFDIDAAAFVLFAASTYFPKGTIFLAVVDPGVGSGRKIILAETTRYFFIAPDNGVLSLALAREKVKEVREVTNSRFFLRQPSRTFEARDKMAPVAAWLSRGQKPESFGPKIGRYVKRNLPEPEFIGHEIRGRILYADKFGNLITNIPGSAVTALRGCGSAKKLSLFINSTRIGGLKESYASARKGELFFLIGSLGLIEIAARESSAFDRIKPGRGAAVRIFRVGPKD
ncbi:MAG: SAM-dependent chlorinase/fluorinase [Clostridiales bacterium]|nr:SAM-dependent chlorinase/fluorinase [Clostridiales bacterium]